MISLIVIFSCSTLITFYTNTNMSNNVEQYKITCNEETYTRGTYNGISVIIHDTDGFINATDMCKQFNKRFAKINENHSWQAYYQAFLNEYYALRKMGGQGKQAMYLVNKGIPTKYNELRGTYVDPRLINYIAIWASPQYAISVGKIMDEVNNKVHQVLKDNQQDDTPTNANKVFNSLIDDIKPALQSMEIEEVKLWGVRDSSNRLGQWDQEDLANDIHNYEQAKERLIEAERKVDEWGSFVRDYHPSFRK